MSNETGKDTSTLESEICDAVEQGANVQEKVRRLTLSVISSRSLDINSIRQTADAVMRGARAGVQKQLQQSSAQTDAAREHLKQAVTGLDVALAQFAEAAKLTVEEAAGKAKKYSSDDLKRAKEDLGNLEKVFVDTLQSSAATAKNAAEDILRDLAAHARTQGTAVGKQMQNTLSVFTHHIGSAGRAQVDAGLHLARNTADLVRQIAAGVLTGLAEHIQPGQARDKDK